MTRRNCSEVISEMIQIIPETKEELINDLKWNHNDSLYKAPEETLQWFRTMETLMKHIPVPIVDWEFDVLSKFTTKSVDQLKEEVKN